MLTDWIPIMVGLTPSPDNLFISWGVHLIISLSYGWIFGLIFYLFINKGYIQKIFKRDEPNYFQIALMGIVYAQNTN
jgi:hypothetical protein